jgi:hypothetical protein
MTFVGRVFVIRLGDEFFLQPSSQTFSGHIVDNPAWNPMYRAPLTPALPDCVFIYCFVIVLTGTIK